MSIKYPQYQTGVFETYVALTKIHLGEFTLNIAEGSLFDYDGSEIIYEGIKYRVPQLRKVYGSWFVPESDTTSRYLAPSSQMQVTPCVPGEDVDQSVKAALPAVTVEESVVTNVTEQTARREAAARGSTEEVQAIRQKRQERVATAVSYGKTSEVAETPSSVQEADKINREAIAKALSQSAPAAPSRDMMGGVRHNTPAAPEKGAGKFPIIQANSGVAIPYDFSTNNVGPQGYSNVPTTDVTSAPKNAPVQVGKAPRRAVQASSPDSPPQSPPKAPQGPVVLSAEEELEGVTSSWVKRRAVGKRVQDAVDFYGDWPEAIDAICAIESPKVAEMIRKEVSQ